MRQRTLVGAVVLLLGCSASGAPTPPLSLRDSAGVEIVEHAAGYEATLPAWIAVDSPIVDLGGRDDLPGHDLHQVSGAARLQDGRIVVANRGSGELRFFDRTGAYRSASGRRGSGPGEFEYLGVLQRLPGDTLFALDGQLRRGSFFAPSGEFLRTIPTMFRGEKSYRSAWALLDDGRLLGIESMLRDYRDIAGPVRRDSFAIVVFNLDRAEFDTVALVPGQEVYPSLGYEAGNEFPTIKSLEFGRSTVYATDGRRVFVGTNESGGIRVYDSGGRLLRLLRSATPAEPVTEEHRKRRAQETLARYDRQQVPEAVKADWRKNAESVRFAETFPFYERLLVGTDGTLWVELARRFEDEGRRYLVYDSTGRAMATVSVPARVRPYEVGPQVLLGLWRDPDEVQHVRVYQVRGER